MKSSLTDAMQRFVLCIILAVFLTAVILVHSLYRDASFRAMAKTPAPVIQTPIPRCTPAPVQLNVDSDRQICRPLMRGEENLQGHPHSEISPTPSMTANDYVELATADCDCFRSRLGYFTAADITDEERAFPIAFSLLTYENLEQTERLLRLVYRPHNLYCIHVDRKSEPEMHRGVAALAACLPNVLVARPTVNVTWGEITVVQAELLCMGYLLANSEVRWKYFINLVARDLPLRTNEELVKILKTYAGANDIHGTRK